MLNVLDRFAAVLSIFSGVTIAYFFCGFDRYPSEAFVEWGWIVAVIAVVVVKSSLLSKNFIRRALASSLPA